MSKISDYQQALIDFDDKLYEIGCDLEYQQAKLKSIDSEWDNYNVATTLQSLIDWVDTLRDQLEEDGYFELDRDQ